MTTDKTPVDSLIESSKRTFGPGALFFAEGGKTDENPSFTSGSFGLDTAIGIGGYPVGRIVEVVGPDTPARRQFIRDLAAVAIAEAQKASGVAAYVDAEHEIRLQSFRDKGVDCSRMLLSQPDCGEQAFDVIEALVRSGQVSLVVVDSVVGLTPKAEIDGEVIENHVGLQARLMSRSMRKLASLCFQTGTTLMFLRYGGMSTVVNALKFYASLRLGVWQLSDVVVDGNKLATSGRIHIMKNKMAMPFRSCEVTIYESGVDEGMEVMNAAVQAGAVERAGAFYRFEGENIGQGLNRSSGRLRDESELMARVKQATIERVRKGYEDSQVTDFEV